MATLGGKFLFDQPIQFEGDGVSVGDENTTVGPNTSHYVVVGAGSRIGHDSTGSVVLGAGCAVGDISPNNYLAGQGSTIGDSNSGMVVIGHTNTISNGPANDSVAIGSNLSLTLFSESVVLGKNHTVSNCLADVVIGRSLTIGPNASSCVLIGDISSIGAGSDTAIGIGRQVQVGANCNSTIVQGFNCIASDRSPNGIVIGVASEIATTDQADVVILGHGNTVFGNGSVGTQSIVAVGSSIAIGDVANNSAFVQAVGANITTAHGALNVSCYGSAITVGNSSVDIVAVGDTITIGNSITKSCLIGHNLTVPNNLTSVIGIGSDFTIAAVQAIVMGNASVVNINNDNGVAINGAIQNTNGANTKASIAINGAVGIAPVFPALATASTGGNIAIGGVVFGNTSVGCTAINGFIGDGTTGSISIFGNVGQNCISTVSLGGSTVDAITESMSVLGQVTVSHEMIFGIHPTFADPGHGVSLFHAPSTLLDSGNVSIDLFKFLDTTVTNPGDTSMYLLFKDAGGNLTLSQVKASTAPAGGSLLLYM